MLQGVLGIKRGRKTLVSKCGGRGGGGYDGLGGECRTEAGIRIVAALRERCVRAGGSVGDSVAIGVGRVGGASGRKGQKLAMCDEEDPTDADFESEMGRVSPSNAHRVPIRTCFYSSGDIDSID